MPAPDTQTPAFFRAFDSVAELSDAQVEGDVSISRERPYSGDACLLFRRSRELMETQPTSVTLPTFALQDGIWEFSVAMRAALDSPDSSYNGTLRLELLDAAGERLDRYELAFIMGDSDWTVFRKRLELPGGVAAARLVLSMEKASGAFAVDQLRASYVGPSLRTVTSIRFASDAVGNLFLPDAPVRFRVSAVCRQERAADARVATVTVRDYWGAEFAQRDVALVDESRNDKGLPVYSGDLDLSDLDWVLGKYYELHGELPEPQLPEPARDTSSFAVLPEAVTKQHPPFDIPFTASCWNPGVPNVFPLIDRLGLRVTNVYSRTKAEPPYGHTAPGIEEVIELGMGALLTTSVPFVERRAKGFEKYDYEALYQGAYNLVMAYKDRLPIALRVGNEPHPADEDDARRMIQAYKATYEGAKAADPSVIVTATSCGSEEVFFKNGYQDFHDVFIYHDYKDSQTVYTSFERYEAMVAKYGKRKPVWSTELGLNSNGMSRDAVAIQLIKVFTNFFACGGQNASWFGIMWPDPEGKLVGTNGDSFDVYNSKYCLYSPKMTAIAEYHFVNALCVKKIVAQKQYPCGTQLTLFRDDAGNCLVIAYNDDANVVVDLPLPEVGAVRATRLDGAGSDLHAAGDSLTLCLSDEPYLLLFESADLRLPDTLPGSAGAAVDGDIPAVVKGGSSELRIRCAIGDAADLTLAAPPRWTVERLSAGDAPGIVRFQVSAPAVTEAREGRLLATLPEGRGELYLVMPVRDAVAVKLLPLPFVGDADAGYTVKLSNNGTRPQSVDWAVEVPERWEMDNGTFKMKEPDPYEPSFSSPAEGRRELAPGETAEIPVQLADLDPLALYHGRLSYTLDGRTRSLDRIAGGFVGVPRISRPVAFDGQMGDPAWQQAAVVSLDQYKQVAAVGHGKREWDGPDDLSGQMYLMWDADYFYLGMKVRDSVYCQPEVDNMIWRGDGLQFLVDPCRDSDEKPGKYDYIVAKSRKGDQAWCAGTADAARAPSNEVTDFRLQITPTGENGNMIYEVAIPWHRISPFEPKPGGNIGLAMIINDDDGQIRDTFIAWFGCAHSKQMAMNGDLILLP